jgi:peptidoglycan hydrolase-like protein with peptidoglycan-binding domain
LILSREFATLAGKKECAVKNRSSILVLILYLSACNLPVGSQQDAAGLLSTQVALTVTAAAQGSQPIATLVTQSFTPTATATLPPAPTATNTSLPCNMASFVSDVSYPDDSVVTVNTAFTKTWKLKNVGSCTWTSGYQLIFDSGDQMGGPASQQLTNGTVAPGGDLNVSVDLTAPANTGTYKGNWKIREPGGAVFALSTGPFWVQIKAAAVPQAGWPTFEKGDSGDEVFAIQFLLKAHGEDLNADGIFGPITQAKVEDFQTDNNLNEDGFVGPETWQELIIQVSQGANGFAVRAVQKLLKDKYGYNIAVDGIFGPATADAVKDFQDDNGLAADGIVGPKTWRKLISN